jgi:aminopeptidase N
MEQASGQDLRAFFDQWLYRGEIPRLEGTWRHDAATREVVVDLRQVQPGPAFDIEVEVAAEGADGSVTTRPLKVAAAASQVRIPAAERLRRLTLDPRARVLFAGELRPSP